MIFLWIFLAVLIVYGLTFLLGHRVLYVVSRTEIPGGEVTELFEFVTDIKNDHLWYEGIERTELNIDGAPDLTERQYTQYGKFNGLPFKNVITFKATGVNDANIIYLNFIGNGGVVFYSALYLFERTEDGVRFVNTSTVANIRIGYLFTNPLALFSQSKSNQILKQYTEDAQHKLISALKKEGVVDVKIETLKF
jgi:hypothetical protein